MKQTTVGAAGSALLVALLIALTLVAVGSAVLTTTGTEARIARNEADAARARYAAEAGARAVRGWFERPGSAPGFPPDLSVILRDRAVLDETDPYGTPPDPAGTRYKDGVDRDADGVDDLFRSPYAGTPEDTLLGSESAPDMRIDDEPTLRALSRTLFGADGDSGSGVRLSLARIDVYAPPHVRREGRWTRDGTATIKVVARVERVASRVSTRAERTARLVLDEVRYAPETLEAVHACGDAALLGGAAVRWGALVATGRVLAGSASRVPPSLPRALPTAERPDPLWTEDAAWVAELDGKLDPAGPLTDPWARLLSSGPIEDAPTDAAQPWGAPSPPPPGTPAPWSCCDRSNRIQHQPGLRCPRYDYAYWKGVARSGLNGARYFRWDTRDVFVEDGVAPGLRVQEIAEASAGRPALYFFDTADGRAPHDDDGDGAPDNLTPPVTLSGSWSLRGVVLLNAERVELTDGRDTLEVGFRAPGEPRTGSGEAWVDLVYPDGIDGPFLPAGGGVWDSRGPVVTDRVVLAGLLVTRGTLVSRGGGTLYGSVVAADVILDGGTGPARVFRDVSVNGPWPPEGWGLPRFAVRRFSVE